MKMSKHSNKPQQSVSIIEPAIEAVPVEVVEALPEVVLTEPVLVESEQPLVILDLVEQVLNIQPIQKELFDFGTENLKDVKLQKVSMRPTSKADVARRIFLNNYGKKSRKDILVMFRTQAELTKAGSETYYNNFMKQHVTN